MINLINLPTNISNPLDLVVYEATQVPSLVPLLLMFVWIAVMGAGYMYNVRRAGSANFFMWATIGGTITFGFASILFLLPTQYQLIDITTMVFVLSILILCAVGFFLTREPDGL